MHSAKQSVKAKVAEHLKRRALERITEGVWHEFREQFPETTEGYLRRLLRDSGIPLDPLVEGVRQESLEELERTLLALGREYSLAAAAGRSARARRCRELVLEAKHRGRWAARKTADSAKRSQKEEMLQWMLVWLEDPSAFPPWVSLRKRAQRPQGG